LRAITEKIRPGGYDWFFGIHSPFVPNFAIEKFLFMGVWKQISEYLYLSKKDPDAPASNWLGKMHAINRLSIFMFLVCMLIILIRTLFR
jgi:Ni,Fe-hydrogenase I cytochrome b subunit